MVRVKVCGLTREEDVIAAVQAGADATGFIVGFPSSPRNITFTRAAELARLVPPFVDAVLVAPAEVVREKIGRVRAVSPDAVQAYGEDPGLGELVRGLGASMVKAVGVRPGVAVRQDGGKFDALLLDNYAGSTAGGTGITPDWATCRRIVERLGAVPVILSGGLNEGNVGRAIRRVRPFAVDVSSGVEASPGKKDAKKIRKFVAAVQRVARS